MAAAILAFAAIAMAAASTAMSSTSVIGNGPPIAAAEPTPSPDQPAGRVTSIMLLVESAEHAERYRSSGPYSRLLGARGLFELSVAVVRTTDEEILLRSMLLSDTICPPGFCGDVAIIDLRGPN